MSDTDRASTVREVRLSLSYLDDITVRIANVATGLAVLVRVFADELKSLHIPVLGINSWWVPLVECSAGGAVVVGLFAPLAALGLIVIILVANATMGRQRISSYKPIDKADRIDDWLYLPEACTRSCCS